MDGWRIDDTARASRWHLDGRQIANSEGYADRLVVRVECVEADQLPRANCLSSC
jgi:hypothetical protein